MLFGANEGAIDRVTAVTHGVTAVRVYRKDWTPIPTLVAHQGTVPIVSINDQELTAIAAGAKDAAITAFMSTLPEYTLLCLGQELNGDRFPFTPDEVRRAVTRLDYIATRNNFPVYVGFVAAMWPVAHHGQDFAPWAFDGLHWYGLDGYQDHPTDTPETIFGKATALLQRDPFTRIIICETNSHTDPNGWLRSVTDYANEHDFGGVLLFANGNPPYTTLPDSVTMNESARLCAIVGAS